MKSVKMIYSCVCACVRVCVRELCIGWRLRRFLSSSMRLFLIQRGEWMSSADMIFDGISLTVWMRVCEGVGKGCVCMCVFVFPPVLLQDSTCWVIQSVCHKHTVCILSRTFLDINTFYCVRRVPLKIPITLWLWRDTLRHVQVVGDVSRTV